MKKMLATLAAAAMLGTLVSCGKDTADSPAESSAAETTTAETSAESSEESSEEESSVSDPLPRDVGPIDENAVTFEDDDMRTAHQMDGGTDECNIELSIEDLDGDKKLRVHPVRDDDSKDYGVVKLVFDVPNMVGAENVANIGRVTVDFTCIANGTWVNDDGSESLVVGNFLGTVAGQLAAEKGKDDEGNLIQNSWAQSDFAYQDWEHSEGSWRCETTFPINNIPANGFAANDPSAALVIMRWGQKNDVDFYIDNITFYDKDGNSMPVLKSDAAGAEGAENTEEAPAEEFSESSADAAE